MDKQRRIAIVGAGITGLTSAYQLQKSGVEVVLFERREGPGGSIKSVGVNGWRVEYGPNTLQVKSQEHLDFLSELGLEEEMVEADPESSKRYVLKGGDLHQVPMKPVEMIQTSLIGRAGKVGILGEPFAGRGDDPDETLESFVLRRLGREFLDYAVDPFVAGVYAGQPHQLSVRHAFPRLYQLEQRYGSLVLGALAGMWRRRRDQKFRTRLISFRGGLQRLPDRIAELLMDVRFGHDVNRIQKNRSGWEVHANGNVFGPFEKILLNVPLYRIQEQLVDGGSSILSCVKRAGYPPLSVLLTGYKRGQVEHPLDGFGFLVPEKERRKILGTLFSSTLFPGRAPAGHLLLTTFIGGARQPDLAALDTKELIRIVGREHREILGVKGEPVFVDHIYWPKSIPQYGPAYDEVLQAIRDLEAENSGLHLIGNFREGISLPDCIENGILWASRLRVG